MSMTDPRAPTGAFPIPAGAGPPRPAAPVPHARPLSWLATLRALTDNPVTAPSLRAFEEFLLPPGPITGMRLVNDPQAIAHILIGNAANYRKSPEQRRLLEPVLGSGIITTEGAAWRGARAGVAPAFTPRAVAARAGDILACAEALARRWEAAGPHSGDITTDLQALAFDIASRALFGGALGADRADIRQAVARCLDTLGRLDLAALLRLPPVFSGLGRLKARAARATLRRLVADALVDRLSRPREGEPDLLDRLIAGAPGTGSSTEPDLDALSAGFLTFLVAGHETTGNALAWALYLLALHPAGSARMRQELAAAGPLLPAVLAPEALPHCRAIISETLRLYPPVPFIGREAIGEDWLGEVRLPPGGRVMIAPWIVHRHRRLWEAPDLFRPERFLEPAGRQIPRGAYLPFGLGPRGCIGQGFAVQELLLVLGVLVPRFDFDLVAPERVFPLARITLSPRGGLPMRIRPRQG